jgi:hypothetical protein
MEGAGSLPDQVDVIVVFSLALPRGEERLLAHCQLLSERAPAPAARERLQEKLGEELTRLLLFALAGNQRRRPARGGKPRRRT